MKDNNGTTQLIHECDTRIITSVLFILSNVSIFVVAVCWLFTITIVYLSRRKWKQRTKRNKYFTTTLSWWSTLHSTALLPPPPLPPATITIGRRRNDILRWLSSSHSFLDLRSTLDKFVVRSLAVAGSGTTRDATASLTMSHKDYPGVSTFECPTGKQLSCLTVASWGTTPRCWCTISWGWRNNIATITNTRWLTRMDHTAQYSPPWWCRMVALLVEECYVNYVTIFEAAIIIAFKTAWNRDDGSGTNLFRISIQRFS